MREPQRESAARRRRILILAMAAQQSGLVPCCQECGSAEGLELHHMKPRDWNAAEMNRWHRQLHYERDFDAGNLVLLCAPCNKLAGQPSDDSPDAPF